MENPNFRFSTIFHVYKRLWIVWMNEGSKQWMRKNDKKKKFYELNVINRLTRFHNSNL